VCAPKNSPVFAMPLDAKGETQPSGRRRPKGVTSDVPTPAFYKGKFYVLDGGKKTLSCLEPKTGKVLWTGELGGKTKFESSPTVADDKVYCINFWGEVYVAKANTDKFELLGMNRDGRRLQAERQRRQRPRQHLRQRQQPLHPHAGQAVSRREVSTLNRS
jgi:outer membrane protein assembly factor BamB